MTIWNLGSINIDHFYRLDQLPRPGETLAARSHAQGLGGKGANQSIAAACAGADAHHLGAMGRDEDWVIDRLAKRGVVTTDILRMDDQATGHAIILLDDRAENAIVTIRARTGPSCRTCSRGHCRKSGRATRC